MPFQGQAGPFFFPKGSQNKIRSSNKTRANRSKSLRNLETSYHKKTDEQIKQSYLSRKDDKFPKNVGEQFTNFSFFSNGVGSD